MISIIIPTYKGSETVELAVLSSINQTIRDKEIIVVDDNGINTQEQINTQMILQKYIDTKKIIYVCHEKNRNGSAARNTGYENSNGNYITFVDDDDYIFPSKLEKQLELINSDDESVGMCVTEGYYVDLHGCGYYKKINGTDRFLYKYLTDKIYFNTTSVLFKRKVLESVGGFDDTFIRHQDWELCTRVLVRYKAVVLHEPLMIRYLVCRNNPNSVNVRIDHLDFFLTKLNNEMKLAMSDVEINKVVIFRKREITQCFIRKREIMNAWNYAKSYGGKSEFLLSMVGIALLGVRKIIKGSRHVTKTRNELMDCIVSDSNNVRDK